LPARSEDLTGLVVRIRIYRIREFSEWGGVHSVNSIILEILIQTIKQDYTNFLATEEEKMSNLANEISLPVESPLKENVEHILNTLGLTIPQAILLFLKQVELHQGLPVVVEIPKLVFNTLHPETLAALQEAQNLEQLPTFDTLEELYKDLGI
jgi:DNA-damage-inducible protein J